MRVKGGTLFLAPTFQTFVPLVRRPFEEHCKVAVGAVAVDQHQHTLPPAREGLVEPTGSLRG
jgi:hypothetical protein